MTLNAGMCVRASPSGNRCRPRRRATWSNPSMPVSLSNGTTATRTRGSRSAREAPMTSAAVTSANAISGGDHAQRATSAAPIRGLRQRVASRTEPTRTGGGRDKSITPLRHGFDEPWRIGGITERRANLGDAEVEAALEVDKRAVAPDLLPERVPRRCLPRAAPASRAHEPAAAAAGRASPRGSRPRCRDRIRRGRSVAAPQDHDSTLEGRRRSSNLRGRVRRDKIAGRALDLPSRDIIPETSERARPCLVGSPGGAACRAPRSIQLPRCAPDKQGLEGRLACTISTSRTSCGWIPRRSWPTPRSSSARPGAGRLLEPRLTFYVDGAAVPWTMTTV